MGNNERLKITYDNDLLGKYIPENQDHELLPGKYVGVHVYCGGVMFRNGATATEDSIICRTCYLRVLFPKSIKTAGALREFFSHRFALAEAATARLWASLVPDGP